MEDFNNVIGNEKVVEYMQKIIKINKVPHAFIISGDKGLGKSLIGKVFAKTLECEKGNVNPCNECVSCKTFDSNNHTDIFFINSNDKKSIGVDIIREKINVDINILPYQHKYKIYIIEDADKMTIQSQNALLKTIEEPPSYCIFILLAENYNNFLPTVISRCIILKLKPVKIEEVKAYVAKNKNIDGRKNEIVSNFGRGNIGKTLLLLEDEEFINMKENVTSILSDLKEKDIIDIFEIANSFKEYKDRVDDLLEIMYLWFRDLLVYKKTNDKKYIFDKNSIRLIKKNSGNYSLNALYKNLDEINKAKYNLRYNGNFQLTMEIMLLNIKE